MAKTTREQLEDIVRRLDAKAAEIDARGDGPTGEEITDIKGLMDEGTRLRDVMKAQAELTGTQDDLKSFLTGLGGGEARQPVDVRVENLSSSSGIANPKGGTLGEAFTKSPAYEEFLKRFRGSDGAIQKNAAAKSDLFHTKGFDSKALVTGASSTSGGAFIENSRLPGFADLIGEREFTVRDLCTQIDINSDTFEYVRVTAKTNNAAGVPEATSAAVIDGTVVTNAAGGLKPESGFTLDVVTSPVETIAHWIPITRRAAADAQQVRQMIDAFLLYGLREEEEDQILNGNGTSPNLRGILQTAGISTVGSAGTDIDAIVDAIRTIRGNRRRPTAMVVHPNDWYSTGFLLAKDTAGNYLVGDPRASVDQLNTLWGLRVVVTPAMTENTALVGDFRQAVVADRQQSTLYVTDSHADFFTRNILVILAEERLGFGVLDPEAFCTVTAV